MKLYKILIGLFFMNNTFFNCQIVETINQVDELIINNYITEVNLIYSFKYKIIMLNN